MMPDTAVKPARSSAIVVPNAPRWHQRVGAWATFALMKTVCATMHFKWTDLSGYFDGPPPGATIYCTWHNRLAVAMPTYFGHVRKHNRTAGLAALVSASRDGRWLTGILECFGVQPV